MFIYAIANHSANATGVADWWQNTNFEIIINQDDSTSQYYAISSQIRGFDSFYFKTSGTNGNYTSVLEAFIADCELFENGIDIGYAFKIRDYTNGIYDDILQQGTIEYTDYWWPSNKDPHTLPFTLTNEKDIVLPEPPTSSSSSSSSAQSSSVSSSSSVVPSSSSQNNTSSAISSSSQEISSQTSSTNTSETTTSDNSNSLIRPTITGCTAKLNATYLLLPLALIALVVFIKKTKKQ